MKKGNIKVSFPAALHVKPQYSQAGWLNRLALSPLSWLLQDCLFHRCAGAGGSPKKNDSDWWWIHWPGDGQCLGAPRIQNHCRGVWAYDRANHGEA